MKRIFIYIIILFAFYSCKNADIEKYGLKMDILARMGDMVMSVDSTCLEVLSNIESGDGSAKNPYILNVEVNNTSNDIWKGILYFKISVEDTTSRFFMPGFLYGRNRGDANIPGHPYPRLKAGGVNLPYSDYWLVRSDRVTHPVSLMFVNDKVVGISATPYFVKRDNSIIEATLLSDDKVYQYNGFGCQLNNNSSSVIFSVGYENSPILYVSSSVQQKEELSDINFLKLASNEKLKFKINLYVYEANSTENINDIFKNIYFKYHQSPRIAATYKETVKDISDAIYMDAWVDSVKNYGTQVYNVNGSNFYNMLASIGWTGGVEIATPLLMAGIRLNDDAKRTQAIECINNIVQNSINEKSGLPYDAYNNGTWTTDGWWAGQLQNRGHSSYLSGHCAYYILKAYDYEKKIRNIDHKDWLLFVKKILDVFVSGIDYNGEFPYIFSEETGEGLEYNSFSGAWCLASLSYYSMITGDEKFIPICKKSEKHYYDKYLSKMECYGTPHDTSMAVDSEGILAYIKAVKILHSITGETLYLNRLGKGLDYEFTFKFPYNVVQNEEPLKKIGWSSCGGSITSTCNPHIHPMSSNVLDELYYYCSHIDNNYYKSRLDDVVLWSLQCHNRFDGEFDYGKKGWMSERFCYSQGLLTDGYGKGKKASIWFCFLPWGASNIIEGLCGELWDTNYCK